MKSPVQLTIPGQSRYLSLSRKVLTHLLSFYDVPKDIVNQVVLAVDEACSNVIKYGYGGDCDCPIEISYQVDHEDLVIKIRDYGKQCDSTEIKPRDVNEIRPGGLGTFFINEIMDSVHYCTNREKGTLLTLTKKIPSMVS